MLTELEDRELAAAQERESEVTATKNLEAEVTLSKIFITYRIYLLSFSIANYAVALIEILKTLQIERLRKEGSRLLEEEQERMREELKKTNISGTLF